MEEKFESGLKSFLDFKLRTSVILIAVATFPLLYLGWGILERMGVLKEAYANHAFSAIEGGILMSLASPVLFFLAYRFHLKKTAITIGSLVFGASAILTVVLLMGLRSGISSAPNDVAGVVIYIALILVSAAVAWSTRNYRPVRFRSKK